MASPAGPIYASTLHRRDRAWGRRAGRMRMRLAWWSGAGTVAAAVIAHFT